MKKIFASGLILSSLFLSGAGVALAASPNLTTTGGTTPFSTITIAGTGFAPGEQVQVSLGLNSTTTIADTSGSFAHAELTIPNLPPGLYLVLAIGQSSGTPTFSYLYVQSLYPLASPSSWYIAPGSTLTWSGSGFAPNETLSVALTGSTTLATFSTDTHGSFTAAGSSQVPFSLRNSAATYTLTGTQSGNHTYTIGVSDLYPYVNPSTWYTTPGTNVTFTGAGFGAGEGVSVYLGASTTPLAHITTDSSGSFSGQGSITIPYQTTSPAPFRLIGDLSGATALAPITLAPFYPTLHPSAYYAAPGSYISLGGSGFAPNEMVAVTVGTASSTRVQTDATGTFTIPSLRLPTTPNTTLAIAAMGELSGAHTSMVMAIGAYYAWMTLGTYWAQGGSPLTIFGHNFNSGETVTIASASSTLGSATAANDGSFTANLSVPFQPSGTATLVATGNDSGALANATMTIAPVYSSLEMKNYFGAPGATLEFIGHGYLPNETIALTTDRGSGAVATWDTNATGDFNYTGFSIPDDFTEGLLTLTATSNYSFDSKSVTIYVTGK
ncbi:MAG: hypothetical protein QG621_243 [Patescibacteria group bacterium]|jgi:hypothetical protein|nr:hypothetical protein [Patescibacteria group bacterium]